MEEAKALVNSRLPNATLHARFFSTKVRTDVNSMASQQVDINSMSMQVLPNVWIGSAFGMNGNVIVEAEPYERLAGTCLVQRRTLDASHITSDYVDEYINFLIEHLYPLGILTYPALQLLRNLADSSMNPVNKLSLLQQFHVSLVGVFEA